MDERFTVHPTGSVAVLGDRIIFVGDRAVDYDAAETVDCHGRVVMPGLVNAHTHAPMTLLRGLADDLRLDVWLMGYMMPVEREFVRPDFVELGTKLACAEMIRSGITRSSCPPSPRTRLTRAPWRSSGRAPSLPANSTSRSTPTWQRLPSRWSS